jgi:hypothetical protein
MLVRSNVRHISRLREKLQAQHTNRFFATPYRNSVHYPPLVLTDGTAEPAFVNYWTHTDKKSTAETGSLDRK